MSDSKKQGQKNATPPSQQKHSQELNQQKLQQQSQQQQQLQTQDQQQEGPAGIQESLIKEQPAPQKQQLQINDPLQEPQQDSKQQQSEVIGLEQMQKEVQPNQPQQGQQQTQQQFPDLYEWFLSIDNSSETSEVSQNLSPQLQQPLSQLQLSSQQLPQQQWSRIQLLASLDELQSAPVSQQQSITPSQLQPPVSSQPQPATSSQRQPAVSSQPQPAASSQPQPATSSQRQPAVSSQPQPAASSQPQPAASSQSQLATSSQPQPAPPKQESGKQVDQPRVQWEIESRDTINDDQTDDLVRREASTRFIPSRTLSKVFRKGQGQVNAGTDSKLGWIQGVFLSCLVNICSAALFLRLPWMVGQAGVLHSLAIVGSSAAVCVISTLSMCAIFTNGIVGKGGVYYTISRSLGPELGASVGVIFAFANALSCSVNAVGFCDSFIDFLKSYNMPVTSHSNTYAVWVAGTLFLVVTAIICAAGLDSQNKAQTCLLVVVTGTVFVFVLSALIGPTNDTKRAKGFVGMSAKLFHRNLHSDFTQSKQETHNWFTVFAVFFPTVTNVHVGANLATELKDPITAIPKGSILAAVVSMILYAVMVLVCGASAVRDASGKISDIQYLDDGTLNYDALAVCGETKQGCDYGLHNDYNVIMLMSLWDLAIYLGCWAATFSTVLTNLYAVPRLLEALGLDEIYPGMGFFAKPYGKHKEPYRGYVLTLIISISFMLLADINTISPLTTSFFLAAYALINFCTFHAASVNPIGWRPTFKYYNIYVSLLGAVLCVGIMVVISWMMFVITIVLFFFLYLFVHYRHPKVNWGSSTQAQAYKSALSSVYTLARTGEHVKNYWPQLLVLTGKPANRPILTALGHLITMGGSLMICGEIVREHISNAERIRRLQESYGWLRERKIRSFCAMVTEFSFGGGVRALIQSAGVGRLCPNIILLGYKNNWHSVSCERLNEYFNVLHMAFETGLAVTILRVEGGLDWREHRPNTHHTTEQHSPEEAELREQAEHKAKVRAINIRRKRRAFMMTFEYTGYLLESAGNIDVWWLYHDGGLTMLIPYIISERSTWTDTKLRIFSLCDDPLNVDAERESMALLLNKFRISYSSLTILDDIGLPPNLDTVKEFNELIEKYRNNTDEACQITEAMLNSMAYKTARHLRLHELVRVHSPHARLIVMSLPMPRKGEFAPPLYMAWLEMLSKELPPFLFVRGNKTKVLTYYL